MNIVSKKLPPLCAQEEGTAENRMQEGFLEDPGGAGSNSQTQMGIMNK